jgi:hypothetical protein
MGTAPFRAALRGQARACEELGSPFTARVLRLLAERLSPGSPLADRLFGWPGDVSGFGAAVTLRLAGGLHALVLSGQDRTLAALYPPNPTVDDEALWAGLAAALDAHAGAIDRFLDSAPQTNEIARSASLIAVGQMLDDLYHLPIVLSELGASAGMNLNWDRYAMRLGDRNYGPADAVLTLTPENRGSLPPPAAPRVIERRGVDLNPLDVTDPAQVLRLRAYVWPDQTARHDRISRALRLPPAPLDRGDAAAWLDARLLQPREGALPLRTSKSRTVV